VPCKAEQRGIFLLHFWPFSFVAFYATHSVCACCIYLYDATASWRKFRKNYVNFHSSSNFALRKRSKCGRKPQEGASLRFNKQML